MQTNVFERGQILINAYQKIIWLRFSKSTLKILSRIPEAMTSSESTMIRPLNDCFRCPGVIILRWPSPLDQLEWIEGWQRVTYIIPADNGGQGRIVREGLSRIGQPCFWALLRISAAFRRPISPDRDRSRSEFPRRMRTRTLRISNILILLFPMACLLSKRRQ